MIEDSIDDDICKSNHQQAGDESTVNNQQGDLSTFKNMKAIMDGGTEDKLTSANSKSNQAFGGL